MQVQPWGAVERLLSAAGSDVHADDAVGEIGLAKAAQALVAEVLARCEPPAAGDVRLQVRIGHRSQRVGYVLTFPDGQAQVEPGWTDSADVAIEFDVVDLVRDLFGPGRSVTSARARVSFPGGVPRFPSVAVSGAELDRQRAVSLAIASVLQACATSAADFAGLCTRFGSDKWGLLHWYGPHYDHHFGPLRDRPIRLLEIGIGYGDDPDRGGESLRLFQRYFPRGLIYGLDLFDKPNVRGPRIRTIRGDQNDPEFLTALGSDLGPFDIVIDDGSHVSEHVLTSFHALFPHVRRGGFYVIEDTFTSYVPGYGGNADDLDARDTTVGFLKTLVDGLHYQEHAPRGYQPSYQDLHVVGLHLYHNLAFVEKGLNWEGRLPIPEHRRAPH